MKKTILKITFAVWVGLWLFLIARELFVKDNLRDYKALIGMSLEGKHAYIAGEELYGFLNFCKANLPERAAYGLTGVEDGSLEKRRAVYYLYPLLEKNDPEFILAYKEACAEKDGYTILARPGKAGCIMKKIKAR